MGLMVTPGNSPRDVNGFTEIGDIVTAPGLVGAAILRVTTDGTIIDTTILDAGGLVSVGGAGQTNANASNTTVSGGGLQVLAGGTTTGATVLSGGNETISAGGTAINDLISGGGTEFVETGGTTNGARVFGTPGVVGAVQAVGWQQGNPIALFQAMRLNLPGVGPGTISLAGGTANNTTIVEGFQFVASGGIANGTVLLSGGGAAQLVEIGGTANATAVGAGTNEMVMSGGTANNTTLTGAASPMGEGNANLWLGVTVINGQDVALPGGTAIGTTVNQFGDEIVYAGGVASNTRVNSGGTVLVGGGGVISSTTVLAGGQDLVGIAGPPNAVAMGTVVSGGIEVVEGPSTNLPTGSALGTTVNGGDQFVFGSAVATTVNSGVETVWLNGGNSNSATINAGGFQFVVGTALNDTLNGTGATEFVLSGGSSTGTIVNSGAGEVVSSGSQLAASTVNSGGFLNVNSGGLDVGATVAGIENVFAGGTASGTNIIAGGREVVLTGATSLSPIINGGVLQVVSGGSTGAPPVSFTTAGGTLQLDASRSFTGLIAGFASPTGVTEAIDLRDISFAGAKVVGFTQTGGSGTLTVTNGTATANLTLLGMYSTANFKLASDGAGGTLVTDPAVVTPSSASIAAPQQHT